MLLTNPNTIFPLLSFFLFLSQAQDTIQPISTNLSDSELAISLTPTDQSDAVDRLPIPSDPHTEPYPEYTLRYKHYQKPYTEAEKAQKFLMYCNVLFTNKLLKIVAATKGTKIPGVQWPFLCTNPRLFPDLELELLPSSRETWNTVPLRYIPALMYHMYGFDERWEADCISPYGATAASGDNSTTTGLGEGGDVGRGGYTTKGVPSFEVELSKIDGPGIVFAIFKGKRFAGFQNNGTDSSAGSLKANENTTLEEVTTS